MENIIVEGTQNHEENSSFIMKGIVSVNRFRKECLHSQVGNLWYFIGPSFRKNFAPYESIKDCDSLWRVYLLRKQTLVTEITESKVCQPLYRELEPLDGIVHIYTLMW